jgi:hypothetical protein
MEKNKLKSVFPFLRLFVFSVLTIFIAVRIFSIRSTLKSIEAYRHTQVVTNNIASSGIALLEQEAGKLRGMKISTAETVQTMEELAATIRDLLHAQGARPEQFRIIGKGEDASAEFTLSCPPLPFFNFLLELSKSNAPPLNYINIKPDPASGSIKCVLRLANETGRMLSYRDDPELSSLPPRTLTASFRVPAETKKPAAAPAVSAAVRVEKNNFKYLGSIKDGGGREQIYIKDTDSGDIVAIDSAVQASVNEDAYVVTIGENEYFIRRN